MHGRERQSLEGQGSHEEMSEPARGLNLPETVIVAMLVCVYCFGCFMLGYLFSVACLP